MIVESPYFFFSNLVQSALQVWAAILLFKIPKRKSCCGRANKHFTKPLKQKSIRLVSIKTKFEHSTYNHKKLLEN